MMFCVAVLTVLMTVFLASQYFYIDSILRRNDDLQDAYNAMYSRAEFLDKKNGKLAEMLLEKEELVHRLTRGGQ